MFRETPAEVEERVVQCLELGLTQKQTSIDCHLAQSTVSRISQKYFGKETDMDSVIAGDKKHGTLRCIGMDLFVGSCRGNDGRMHKKRFRAGRKEATKQWEAWKEKLRCEEMTTKATPEPIDILEPAPAVIITEPEPEIIEEPKVEIAEVVPQEEMWRESEKVPTTVYILAVGNPKVAGFFTDFEEAMKTEAIVNQALKFAGIDIRYSIQEVAMYRDTE